MAVGDAYVFPGFLTPVLTQLFFPKPPTTFLTCFSRGERRKTPERKVASNGDRTHNHQDMNPTNSPLSHPGGALRFVLSLCKIVVNITFLYGLSVLPNKASTSSCCISVFTCLCVMVVFRLV